MVLRAFVVLVGVTFAGGVKLGEPAFNGASDENVERAAMQTDDGANPPAAPTCLHTSSYHPTCRRSERQQQMDESFLRRVQILPQGVPRHPRTEAAGECGQIPGALLVDHLVPLPEPAIQDVAD